MLQRTPGYGSSMSSDLLPQMRPSTCECPVRAPVPEVTRSTSQVLQPRTQNLLHGGPYKIHMSTTLQVLQGKLQTTLSFVTSTSRTMSPSLLHMSLFFRPDSSDLSVSISNPRHPNTYPENTSISKNTGQTVVDGDQRSTGCRSVVRHVRYLRMEERSGRQKRRDGGPSQRNWM